MKKLVYFLIIMFVIFAIMIITTIIGDYNHDFSFRFPEALEIIMLNFWVFTFFVYLLQIAIIIIGLLFHFIKEKQTIKNLLVPYGFIFTLKNYYKELQ